MKRRKLSFASTGVLIVAVLASLQIQAPTHIPHAPFSRFGGLASGPSADAFGRSGAVKLRFALPGDSIDYPLQVAGNPATLTYDWVSPAGAIVGDSAQPLVGSRVQAPENPGFYRLALRSGSTRQVMAEPVVAVQVPFARKLGGFLNGYQIGTYVAERLGHRGSTPDGFLEVYPQDVGLAVSEHFKLGEFVTHDDQGDVWPKYVALNPRLLDKLELVVAEVSRQRGDSQHLAVGVHSGFRTPSHNRLTPRSARDSRHQYGDAADVAMDANGDGRIDLTDEIIVARAVEDVEDVHPELVGGMGLYTSRRYKTPYVHIDARGKKSRWHG